MIRDATYGASIIGNPNVLAGSRYQETVNLAFKKSILYKFLGIIFICAILTILAWSQDTSLLSTDVVLIVLGMIAAIPVIQRPIRLHVVKKLSLNEIKNVNEKITDQVDRGNQIASIVLTKKQIVTIVLSIVGAIVIFIAAALAYGYMHHS